MTVRYLRRPPKAVVRKEAARKAKRAAITPPETGPLAAPVKIMPDERANPVETLAPFCVACGREHAAGGVCR